MHVDASRAFRRSSPRRRRQEIAAPKLSASGSLARAQHALIRVFMDAAWRIDQEAAPKATKEHRLTMLSAR